MAQLKIEGAELVVELSSLETMGAFLRTFRVPLAAVARVSLLEKPYEGIRGLRVGTGIPGVILLGRMVYAEGCNFVAIYGRDVPVARIELRDGARFKRLFVSSPDAGVMAFFATNDHAA